LRRVRPTTVVVEKQYFERVFVNVCVQYALNMRHIFIYGLPCSTLFLLILLGAELPLMRVGSFGLLNDIFPFPSILDAGYPVFNLHLANILFDVILPSVLGFSL
jgi:hypothetical protein